MQLLVLLFPALSLTGVGAYNALPPVPWQYSTGTFKFSTHQPPTIYLQTSAAEVRDTDGLTLIPPSAREFAETFAGDLKDAFHVDVKVQCVPFEPKQVDRGPGIYLGIDKAGMYTYESGVETSEGYTIDVAGDSVKILGGGARGIWWGTRTLLQELILAREEAGVRQEEDKTEEVIELKAGRAVDSPAYPTRGFLLDAGRKWYSADVRFSCHCVFVFCSPIPTN